MDDELTIESGLDVLIALLDERGVEHYEYVSPECEVTVYEDKAGKAHECWDGGTNGIVNVVISITPSEMLSVDDLNGVVRENEKLRELAKKMHVQIKETCDVCDGPYCDNFDAENECCVFDTLMRKCGIEPEL